MDTTTQPSEATTSSPYISVYMTEDLKRKVKIHCAREGINMSTWVQGIIRKALDRK